MRRPFPWRVAAVAALAIACGAAACSRSSPPLPKNDPAPQAASPSALVSVPSATAPGAPKAGMTWVPPGILKAGTPLDRSPRISDEELPGTEIPMAGFYVDLLPYPNEPGAIPTTNVSRDEAERACEGKGKRLCTELEWERACKGPDATTYEYGNEYRASTCGTGVVVEISARRPTGEKVGCKSGFGALEMHGGAWEWTGSDWGRGHKEELGVLRGGNAAAGELVGRCANGIARPASTKGPQMGFRCCAGPRNEAKVELDIAAGPPLERSTKPGTLAAPLGPSASAAWKATAAVDFDHAWTWRPAPNEELVVGAACVHEARQTRCGLVVGRPEGESAHLVAQFETGFIAPEVAQNGEARRIRARGLDAQGAFVRDLVYSYGRVEISEPKR
jgi:formylglycine-generating enzyme